MVVFGACATTGARPPLDAAALAQLESLRKHPEAMGDAVYDGAVFPLGPVGSEQIFAYERRVR